jgi:voltage-gated sodium channel
MLKYFVFYSEEVAEKVDHFFETKPVHLVISLLVFVNAAIFAIDAIPSIKVGFEDILEGADMAILGIFIIEMISRMMVTRGKFFKNYWNVFDLIVTAISLLPTSYGLETLRLLRVLHSMRMLELLPKTKHMMDGLAHAIPGLLNVVFLSFVFYFVFSSIAVGLLGPFMPETFGHLGNAMYHLFSVMTSGNWLDYAHQVSSHVPHAGLFFIVFMIVVAYLILNLFIGSVVAAVAKSERENDGFSYEAEKALHRDIAALRLEVNLLQKTLQAACLISIPQKNE